MWSLAQLSKPLEQELVVLLSAVLWALLRVLGVLAKRIESGKAVEVRILGADVIRVSAGGILHTQQAKGKIRAKGASATPAMVSLM